MAEQFDLDELNPGAWFDYGDAQVLVRAHPQQVLMDIKKQCVKKRTEFKQAHKHGPLQPVQIIESDDDKMNRLLWDYALVNWIGFVDASGSEIDCTTENKVKLMEGSPKFYDFVDDCMTKVADFKEQQQDAAEKN